MVESIPVEDKGRIHRIFSLSCRHHHPVQGERIFRQPDQKSRHVGIYDNLPFLSDISEARNLQGIGSGEDIPENETPFIIRNCPYTRLLEDKSCPWNPFPGIIRHLPGYAESTVLA